jgi:hypothetical protein
MACRAGIARRIDLKTMSRIPIEDAYPTLAFRPKSRNWWAKFTGAPAECVHLEYQTGWMATLVPHTLYVRGKAVPQKPRVAPDVSLCRDCLLRVLKPALATYSGRVVSFDPDPDTFTQYFFVGTPDFEASGLEPKLSAAIHELLARPKVTCEECRRSATWLCIARGQVASLDDFDNIRRARGENLCSVHGAAHFCAALEKIPEANLFYVNFPYGDTGAYVWI